jgi:hypothetical protein
LSLFSSRKYFLLDDTPPVLLVSLIDNSRLHIELLNNIFDVSNPLAMEQWHHIGIAHNLSRSEGIKIMINGSYVVVLISSKNIRNNKKNSPTIIDSGGDLFVGQAIQRTNLSRISMTEDSEFDSQRAFYGEIAFLNLWQKILSDYDLQQLAIDCHVQRQECGDAVAWMDFVNDIKGEIKIHWPSGIYSLFSKRFSFKKIRFFCVFHCLANCATQQWLQESCDNYCRKLEGNFSWN